MSVRKYYIRLPGELVEVTEEVYETSRSMNRHYRTIKEKDARNHVVSYDALDTEEMLGIEMISDRYAISVEDQVIAKVMAAELHRSLTLLSKEDQALIKAVYFDGLSEREVSKQMGIPQTTIQYRVSRAVQRLQKYFKQ